MFPNIEIVEAIHKEYPAGTRVRLVKMDDIQAPPLGTEGTVVGVDDTGSLLMHWDNSSQKPRQGSPLRNRWEELVHDFLRKANVYNL